MMRTKPLFKPIFSIWAPLDYAPSDDSSHAIQGLCGIPVAAPLIWSTGAYGGAIFVCEKGRLEINRNKFTSSPKEIAVELLKRKKNKKWIGHRRPSGYTSLGQEWRLSILVPGLQPWNATPWRLLPPARIQGGWSLGTRTSILTAWSIISPHRRRGFGKVISRLLDHRFI